MIQSEQIVNPTEDVESEENQRGTIPPTPISNEMVTSLQQGVNAVHPNLTLFVTTFDKQQSRMPRIARS